MTGTTPPTTLEWCRAYFEHEHDTAIRETGGGGGARFEHDLSLSAIVRRWDAAAVPTLWDYATPRRLRKSVLNRAKAAVGGSAGPRTLFTTDAPVPRGLVLLPRKTGCLVALQRTSGRVVKVESADAYPMLEHEYACLLHLERIGRAEFGSELPDGHGPFTYAPNGSSFRFLRTGYQRNTRPVTAAEWPSLLREWLLPRMFDFYRSWGVGAVDAEEHVAALRRDVEEQGLDSVLPLLDLVDRLRASSGTRTVHLTRCHGDLKRGNVHRDGNDTRLIDWGNSIEANLFFDLSIPFLEGHRDAENKAAYVSPTLGLNVHDGTTDSAAGAFARRAAAVTGERYDEAKLAFHVLCSVAERARFRAHARRGLQDVGDRTHTTLMRSLATADLL